MRYEFVIDRISHLCSIVTEQETDNYLVRLLQFLFSELWFCLIVAVFKYQTHCGLMTLNHTSFFRRISEIILKAVKLVWEIRSKYKCKRKR